MKVSVSFLVDSCNYKLSYFLKVLTRNGISNHIELNKDDLINLYLNEVVKNQKSFLLHLTLEDLLKDDLSMFQTVKVLR
jgi:hypothetical protein